MSSFFEKYPYVNNLRSLVSDELILTEIATRADQFELDIQRAKLNIQTVNLNKIFPNELEKGRITMENFLGHWGNVSVEELCKICLIVRFIKPKAILELGTYNGMTTLQMALNAPKDCVTYTLDLPADLAANLSLSPLDALVSKHLKNKFGTKTGSYFVDRKDLNVVQILSDSATFDYSSLDQKLDIIFIDAAHDYNNKKVDSENAFRMISKGGVIIWHNYNDVTCPDVTKYLADISIHYNIFHLRNTFLAIYYNN
jgi:predicted O-methyltransferase YrrM